MIVDAKHVHAGVGDFTMSIERISGDLYVLKCKKCGELIKLQIVQKEPGEMMS